MAKILEKIKDILSKCVCKPKKGEEPQAGKEKPKEQK